MRLYELIETASVGATASGSVATVSMPIGQTKRRNKKRKKKKVNEAEITIGISENAEKLLFFIYEKIKNDDSYKFSYERIVDDFIKKIKENSLSWRELRNIWNNFVRAAAKDYYKLNPYHKDIFSPDEQVAIAYKLEKELINKYYK